jgi:hypothetical protein
VIGLGSIGRQATVQLASIGVGHLVLDDPGLVHRRTQAAAAVRDDRLFVTVELRGGSVLAVYYEEDQHGAILAWRLRLVAQGIECLPVGRRQDTQPATTPASGPTAHPGEPVLKHVNVYSAGQDGCFAYRIPIIATALNGTLLAFAEARKYSLENPGGVGQKSGGLGPQMACNPTGLNLRMCLRSPSRRRVVLQRSCLNGFQE